MASPFPTHVILLKPMTNTSAAPKISAEDLPTSLLDVYEKMPHVPPRSTARIKKLCGERYVDILFHFPSNLQDRRNTPTIAEAENGELATIQVTVLAHKRGHGRAPYKIRVTDGTGDMDLLFFNSGKWIESAFPVNEDVIIYGKIETLLTEKQIVHPEFFPANRLLEDVAKVTPQYPLTAGVSQKVMARAVQNALALAKKPEQNPQEWLPEKLLKQGNWPAFTTALCKMHLPDEIRNLEDDDSHWRTRLAFDELFAWQLALRHARSTSKQKNGFSHEPAGDMRKAFIKALPFALTGDQQKVVEELDADMGVEAPMLRLVQGDVGSGKTVVAFAALLRAIENGHQGVLMAPTEILAQQHLNNAAKWLEPLGVRIALLTGKVKAAEKRKIKAALQDGEIDLVIGTHALIQDDVILKQCSLVVIDEQHRFGVKQRMALAEGAYAPDLLVMTATPIPRTLALTAYGDMDISIISEKPPGRLPIKTTANPLDKIGDVANALKRVLQNGEQAYWVCPLVEESEKIDLAAATDRFDSLQKMYGEQVALLHGKMKGDEKEQILSEFRDGKYKILVSTTVIEVGVDVPQATVMVIEHAERFGLAQLHQLRGRVGRGGGQSTCILLYATPLSHMGRERINTLRESDDGFVLAEKDMELRGPGEILGTAQAGHVITRVASLHKHKDMIPVARDLAEDILNNPIDKEKAAAYNWLLQAFDKADAVKFITAG